MARMSIDDKFLRDPRVIRLAARLGFSKQHIRGCLLDVFAITYDREDDVLLVEDIDTAAEHDGFAVAMVAERLGEQTDHGIRICGAHERISYLKKKREDGTEGGRKSGESRRNEAPVRKTRSTTRSSASTVAKHDETKPEARRNPSASVPDSASASASAPVSVPAPVPERIAPAVADARSSPKDSAHHALRQQVMDAFQGYFVVASGGAKPTWNEADRGSIGTLVKKHGAHECVRRIAILRDTPPDFPRGTWTVRDFVRFFDKLAASPKARPPDPRVGRVEPSAQTAYVDGEVTL